MNKKTTFGYIKRRSVLWFSRRYREFTAHDRVLPDFIIAGVQKGGTSSLFNYLTQHPNISPGYKKEVKFFDGNYHKGINWYRFNFPLIAQMDNAEQQTGEASPSYVFHPLVPQRINESIPNIKLIILLRNPVARAYSHYQGNLRKGHENKSFEEAIELEESRLDGEKEAIIADQHYPMYKYLVYSYLARGVYIDQIKNWLQSFPREQILILKSEDLFSNPQGVYSQVLHYLGLQDWRLSKFEIVNYGRYKEMATETEIKLRQYFSTYNQELYNFLGKNFGW
jgi:hypothetical protein